MTILGKRPSYSCAQWIPEQQEKYNSHPHSSKQDQSDCLPVYNVKNLRTRIASSQADINMVVDAMKEEIKDGRVGLDAE